MTEPTPPVPRPAPEEPQDEHPSRRGPLIALLLIVVLLAGGLWLSRTLHDTGRLQDCVMSGRTNCAPVGR